MDIGKRLKLIAPIAKGLFSEVYLGEELHSKKKVAIKLEDIETRYEQLEFEYKILKRLTGTLGIPLVYHYDINEDYRFMSMQLLGKDLKTVLGVSEGRFSLKTTLILADKIFAILEKTHEKGVIHRDIKPENFCLGYGIDSQHLYLFDFGLSKIFLDDNTKQHIKPNTGKTMLGQSIFASVNSHDGLEVSRRDDLESVIYMLLLFVVGDLPWVRVSYSKKPKEERFHEMKKLKDSLVMDNHFWKSYKVSLRHTADTEITRIPHEFRELLAMIRDLEFDEKPDYVLYRKIVKVMFQKYGFEQDGVFDWMLAEPTTELVDNLKYLEETLFEVEIDGGIVGAERVEDWLRMAEEDPESVQFKIDEILDQIEGYDKRVHTKMLEAKGNFIEREKQMRRARSRSIKASKQRGKSRNARSQTRGLKNRKGQGGAGVGRRGRYMDNVDRQLKGDKNCKVI